MVSLITEYPWICHTLWLRNVIWVWHFFHKIWMFHDHIAPGKKKKKKEKFLLALIRQELNMNSFIWYSWSALACRYSSFFYWLPSHTLHNNLQYRSSYMFVCSIKLLWLQTESSFHSIKNICSSKVGQLLLGYVAWCQISPVGCSGSSVWSIVIIIIIIIVYLLLLLLFLSSLLFL